MKKYLGIDDLFKLCEKLAKSQGYYGRLLEDLNNLDADELESLNQQMLEQKFTDEIDIILWLEG